MKEMALIADSWRKAGEVLFTQPQFIISHFKQK